ncbi:Obp56h.2 family protein [Megaselia abdita]
MKSTLFVVLTFSVGFALADLMDSTLSSKEAMTECAKELGIDLSRKDYENIPNINCVFKCMMEKDGSLKDGVFSEERLIQVIETEKDLDVPKKAKFIKAMPKCLEEIKEKSDLCTKSIGLVYCLNKSG